MREFDSPGSYVSGANFGASPCTEYIYEPMRSQERLEKVAAWKRDWHDALESGPSAVQAARGLPGPAEPRVVLMQEQWGEEFER